MNAFQIARRSRRFNRILFWTGAVVLAAGVVVLILELVPGSNGSKTSASPGFKARIAKPQPKTQTAGQPITQYSQIDPKAKLAIRKFILGTVAGRDYAGSWPYLANAIKQGYTKKEWVTANEHPVIPYPVYEFDKLSQFQLEEAHPRSMFLTVSVSAAPKAKLRPAVFWIGLVKKGNATHPWLVNYWMPRSGSPPVPAGSEKG